MLKKILLLLFVTTFLFSNVNASVSEIVENYDYYVSIAAIVISIHLLLVSLAYMYANFFMSEELKAWAKNEVLQAIYSMIILGSFLVVFLFINSIATAHFANIIEASNIGAPEASIKSFCFDASTNRWQCGGGNKANQLVVESNGGDIVCKDGNGNIVNSCNPMFLMARSYLGVAYERLASLHKMLLRNFSLMNAMNSMGIFMEAGAGSANLEWGATVSLLYRNNGIYIATLENLLLFVEKILLALKFQESVLKFAEFGLAFYLIILGLIFRSIFIFRKFGGLLLSLGMCFMFVLPLLYIIGWYTLSIPNIEISLTEEFKSSHASAELQWIPFVYYLSLIPFAIARVLEIIHPIPPGGAPLGITKTVIDSFIIISQIIMTVQYNIYVNADTSDFYFTNYKEADDVYTVDGMNNMGVFDYISRLLIIALAVPLLNIYIFFAFVRGLSPLLGGDAEIPALGRFL